MVNPTGFTDALDGCSGEESNQGWQHNCPEQMGEYHLLSWRISSWGKTQSSVLGKRKCQVGSCIYEHEVQKGCKSHDVNLGNNTILSIVKSVIAKVVNLESK